MSGIYGNTPADQYRERQLDEHLSAGTGKIECPKCGAIDYRENYIEDHLTDGLICPECGEEVYF